MNDELRAAGQTLRDGSRRAAATALAMVETRLELAAVELEEERLHLGRQWLGMALGLFCAGMGLLLGCAWLVWAAPADQRLLLLGLLALAWLVLAGLLLWRCRARALARPALLQATLTELQRDAAALRGEGTP